MSNGIYWILGYPVRELPFQFSIQTLLIGIMFGLVWWDLTHRLDKLDRRIVDLWARMESRLDEIAKVSGG